MSMIFGIHTYTQQFWMIVHDVDVILEQNIYIYIYLNKTLLEFNTNNKMLWLVFGFLSRTRSCFRPGAILMFFRGGRCIDVLHGS